MLKHQTSRPTTDSAFHVLPWNVQLSYQYFQPDLLSENHNISTQELVNNVLRFLIFSSGATECRLELFPPHPSASLFPIANAYIASSDAGMSFSRPKNNGAIHMDMEESIHRNSHGKIGKIVFANIPGYRYHQTKYAMQMTSDFFIQFYQILFLQSESKKLRQAYIQMLFQIANHIDTNKLHMQAHGNHTASLAKSIAHQLGGTAEQSLTLYFAGVFHDIGKIIIPDTILNKPSPLDKHEWEIIRTHASFGASLFEPIIDLHNMIPIIRGHHEWIDGSGYPDRLAGEQIPQGARILSVADAYSTMIDGRAYQHKKSPAQAKKEMLRCKESQFDAQIVDALISVLPDH
ncbi:MAG: HD domain-containing protein [Anaerolineaceae bacterium]|nr:HD domain-containing protein [Anaerolineaceae bacterium]